jgi:hypothetical protein
MRQTPGYDEDPYSRAAQDPVYRQRIVEAYEGRHAVMDALWWLSNDAEDSPNGTEAPGANIAKLQRLVYSADAESSEIGVHRQALQQVLSDLASDRKAIWAAVEAADKEPHTSVCAAPDESVTNQAGAGQRLADHRGGRNRSRRLWRSSAATVVVLATGFGLGRVAADIGNNAHQPPSSISTAPPLVDALSIFQIMQDDDDLPRELDPAVFNPESTRLMLDDHDYKVFAARRLSSEVCVVVIPAHPNGYVSSCSIASEFPMAGLQVGWSDPSAKLYTSDGEFDANGVPTSMVATWQSDGRVTTGSAVARN